jgi:hypothetical protein
VRGVVGEQDAAVGTGGNDGRGAAFDQHFQLLLGIPSRGHLAFQLPHVLQRKFAAAGDLVHEQPHAQKG